MANINDIESLFSLIGQSPNDYKEFYHEKNGLHALDKWSYLKNIQLENPNEVGISIFENGPMNPNSSAVEEIQPLTNSIRPELNQNVNVTPVTQAEPIADKVVVPQPKVERYSSPVLESTQEFSVTNNEVETPSGTFSDADVKPLNSEPIEAPEPITPQVYNPASAPQAPKVYTTTAIPSVPSFIPNFASPMNTSTSSTFTSSFVKPTAPINANPQSTFTASKFEAPRDAGNVSQPEAKPNTQNASPLNSIFSRLEQK
jgi:hypothetical protein